MNPFLRMRICAVVGLLAISAAQADVVVSSWIPIFKGVDRAAGTNFPPTSYTINGVAATDSTRQAVNCVRIDLTEPTVHFFTTPRAANYVANSSETYAMTVTNFMRTYGLQVGSDANFYTTSQGSDPTTEGIPANVEGLLVTTGQVVSAVGDNRYATLLFTSNKEPAFVFNNTPPGTNLDGIHTAISGFYPLLENGVNFGLTASNSYSDPSIHGRQPRTAFGLSQDKRYLFMMTIDGRQSGYSDGSYDTETAWWLQIFGAWDGINMDGGGSTSMYMTDCGGNPLALGHSSYIGGRGRERIIGSHFGVSALPLSSFIFGIVATPGNTTATLNWSTESNATSQVEYGLTPNFGGISPLDSTLVTNHSVTLNGLLVGTKYYFRLLSVAGGNQYTSACSDSSFTTTNVGVTLAFDLTNDWKYSFENLDGVNWPGTNYDDTAWSHGPGVLWADSRVGSFPSPNANQIPYYFTGTRMPIDPVATYPYPTYYFRTRFVFPGPIAGASLTLSNFLDDGAVFYLNGVELTRVTMPAGTIFNSTPSSQNVCTTGNATCPLVTTLNGNAISSLVIGTNVLAVETHNQVFNSPDLTFESALFYTVQPITQIITNVVAAAGETNVTITWETTANATTQIQYGLTPAVSSSNAFNGTLVTNHSVTLTGLKPLTTYYFRVLSTSGGSSFFQDGTFATVPFLVPLVTGANTWTFTTNNLDGTNWMTSGYDDSAWLGQGPALLYIEDNIGVSPRNTPLPGPANAPMPTYYFRTHFAFTNSTAGFALTFTNFIDDGAVFYLNGTEIQRVRMPAAPQAITYTTLASDCPVNNCEATLDAPDVFRLSGDALTNLVLRGDNVLAAEVHQFTTNDTDVVFGSAVTLGRALVTETKMSISRSNNAVCLSWAGDGFTLQHANILTGANPWSDVPGPIKSSPYCVTNPPTTTFYRLRN